MAHTRAWDETNPEITSDAGLIHDYINYKARDVRERMQFANTGHKWATSTTTDGCHLYDYIVTANSGSAYTIDPSAGGTFVITLTADCTFTITPGTAIVAATAAQFTLVLIQDGTGGRAVTWPASVKFPYNTTPTNDTTASTVTVMQFISVNQGTRWYAFQSGTKIPA